MLKFAASALRDCAQGGKEDVVPMQGAALGKGVVDTQEGFATADGQDLYLPASEVIAGKRIDQRIHDGVPLCGGLSELAYPKLETDPVRRHWQNN
jgi:hypothetical protein